VFVDNHPRNLARTGELEEIGEVGVLGAVENSVLEDGAEQY
jgi:hypothetical protein